MASQANQSILDTELKSHPRFTEKKSMWIQLLFMRIYCDILKCTKCTRLRISEETSDDHQNRVCFIKGVAENHEIKSGEHWKIWKCILKIIENIWMKFPVSGGGLILDIEKKKSESASCRRCHGIYRVAVVLLFYFFPRRKSGSRRW